MIKGTTPSYIFEIPEEVDFEKIDNVRATFESKTSKITKDLGSMDLDPENKSIKLFLTQEETFELSTGDCTLLVRIHLNDETALSTHPMKIRVDDTTDKEVIKAYDTD